MGGAHHEQGSAAMSSLWMPHASWRKHKLAGDPLAQLDGTQHKVLADLHRMLQAEGAWSHEYHDLYTLRRFLKARDWDVLKAKQMWMDMLAFRANNRVDAILHEFDFHERERVLAAYPHGLHKTDREGRPVLVYKFGSVDLDTLEKVTSTERLTHFHIQEYERIIRCVLPACSMLAGRHIEKIVTLIDVAGMRMRDIGRIMEMLSTYIKVDSNNYPETLAAMIIINAPMWFSGSFSLVKRMLSVETQKKVQIMGSNFQQTLHALIPPENLLPEFGGKSSGRLADGTGPWVAQLERMRAAEHAESTVAHPPAPIAKPNDPGAPAKSISDNGQASPVADTRQRDDDAHMADGRARPQQVSEHVLLPPEPCAPHGQAHGPVHGQAHGAAHAGQKHGWQDMHGPAVALGVEHKGGKLQGDPHKGREVRARRMDEPQHATGEALQGEQLRDLHRSSGQSGVPANEGPAATQQPQETVSMPVAAHFRTHGAFQPLSSITEAFPMSQFSDHELHLYGTSMTAGERPPLTSFRSEGAQHASLDSFYSVADSASWMTTDTAAMVAAAQLYAAAGQQQLQPHQHPLQQQHQPPQQHQHQHQPHQHPLQQQQQQPYQQQQRQVQFSQVSQSSGGGQSQFLTPGAAAHATLSDATGIAQSSAFSPDASLPPLASCMSPPTESGLRSYHSLDSNQAAMYKSLDTALDAVSVVSFESCRSVESVAYSSQSGQAFGIGSPPIGRQQAGKASSRSSSRRFRGPAGESGNSRLPRWPSGRQSSDPLTVNQSLQPQARDWEWDDVDTGAGPPHAQAAAGPYGMLPVVYGPGMEGTSVYMPMQGQSHGGPMLGVPIPHAYLAAMQQPGLNGSGTAATAQESLRSRAGAQINEYMRMWMHSAAEVFSNGGKPHPVASRQQLLDPSDVATQPSIGTDGNGRLGPGHLSPGRTDQRSVLGGKADGELHGMDGQRGNMHASTRAEMIVAAGKAHHRRNRSGSHGPLRIASLSDDAAVLLDSPTHRFMSAPATADIMNRPPAGTVATGSMPTRLAAISYEVYVDSEDEEAGGLLHRQPKTILPRYGAVRTLLRRFMCCPCVN